MTAPNPPADLIERLRECPDIANARIVAPADRVPECVVPIAVRDEAATALEEMLEALTECAQTFRRYEGLHAAKGTMDGCDKAAANALLAERCEATIAKVRGNA